MPNIEVDVEVVRSTHRNKLEAAIDEVFDDIGGFHHAMPVHDILEKLLDQSTSNPQSLMWLILRSMSDASTPMSILAEDMGQVTVSMADPEAIALVGHVMERLVARTAVYARMRNSVEALFGCPVHEFQGTENACTVPECSFTPEHPLHAVDTE